MPAGDPLQALICKRVYDLKLNVAEKSIERANLSKPYPSPSSPPTGLPLPELFPELLIRADTRLKSDRSSRPSSIFVRASRNSG